MDEMNDIVLKALKSVLNDRKKAIVEEIDHLKTKGNRELDIRKLEAENDRIDDLLRDNKQLKEVASRIELKPREQKRIRKSVEEVKQLTQKLSEATIKYQNEQRKIFYSKFEFQSKFRRALGDLEVEKDYYQEKINNLKEDGVVSMARNGLLKCYYTTRINGLEEEIERMKSGKNVSFGARVMALPRKVVNGIRKLTEKEEVRKDSARLGG